jgi:hypothetical protein
MSGDAKMQNAPTIMGQHQEHLQYLEPDGRHRKEVDGNYGLDNGCNSFDPIPFVIKLRVA